jgi:hypothetical protein
MFFQILIGAAIMSASIIVFVRNRSGDTKVLAAVGFLGGVAVILSILPGANGKD